MLESQLRRQTSPENTNNNDEESPALTPQASEQERPLRRGRSLVSPEDQYIFDSPSTNEESLQCRGFLTKSTSGGAHHFYGLSSLHSLVHRMKVHLYLAYGWNYVEEDLHPKTITLSFASPSGVATSNHPTAIQSPADWSDGVYMGKVQEEECLSLFWQSYHCAIPVLDERRFQEHHTSLWSSRDRPEDYRGDSALVDIILAICVQYGMSHVQQDPKITTVDDEFKITDPSNAGRWYFQRSQSLLKADLENPSISLLQCQILSVVYLRDASFFNLALSTVAAALQTAYSLGLHMEAHERTDMHESELLKRLWCMVFVLDGKMSMDYGRPFLAQSFGVRLPRDGHELAARSAEMFVPFTRLRITWLTYHLEHVKLIRTSREVFSKVYDYIAQLLAFKGEEKFGRDRRLIDTCDELLTHEFVKLRRWLAGVPTDLRYYSTNNLGQEVPRTDTDQHTPLWLQRQRVMLRLLYHDIIITLCRPFVIFSAPNEPMSAPTKSALEGLQHSMAITDIAYEALEETDILHGWHRAYQFQWNAALFMIAFAFGNITSPLIDSIVVKLGQAISVLDTFGRCFAVSRSAADIIRDLRGKLQIGSAHQ